MNKKRQTAKELSSRLTAAARNFEATASSAASNMAEACQVGKAAFERLAAEVERVQREKRERKGDDDG